MPTDPKKCFNCGKAVLSRRPSKSGRSYCALPGCVAARQRFYRETSAEERVDPRDAAILEFVTALAHQPRMRCDWCSLEIALHGWALRRKDGQPCTALGDKGRHLPISLLDAVWPERSPANRPRLTPEERGITLPPVP